MPNINSGVNELRGSSWNKWDLHVHTPCSINQQYGGDTDEAWEQFISDLENLPPEFKSIGINDYLFIDGYKKVLDYKKQGRLKNIELILPVVELRIDKYGGTGDKAWKRVNFHVIFSNELVPEVIEEQFLGAIRHNAALSTNADFKFNGVITRKSLEDYGKLIIESSPPDTITESPTKVAFSCLEFAQTKIEEALQSSYLTGKYLTAIGKTEWDAIRWDNASGKKSIINGVDFVFNASPTTEGFDRAKSALKTAGVNDRLIHCSDAHQFSYAVDGSGKPINERIGNCHTWIKSDRTFEGLRQVIYEPEERLKVQESEPDAKSGYLTIDEVCFKADGFMPEKIFINKNLTAIIGGKSTGKSLLLKSIAEAVDPDEVSGKIEAAKLHEGGGASGFHVKWTDGQVDDKSGVRSGKKIMYFPQSYLNRLADVHSDGKESIYGIIEQVIRQDKAVNLAFEGLSGFDWANGLSIDGNIEKLFQNIGEIKELFGVIKEIGDKKGLELEITKLEGEVDTLKRSSGMSTAELGEYESISSKRRVAMERLNHLSRTSSLLGNAIGKFSVSTPPLDGLIEPAKTALEMGFVKIVQEARGKWDALVRSQIDAFAEEVKGVEKTITECSRQLGPLEVKINESKVLQGKLKILAEEQRKLKEIVEKELQLAQKKALHESLIKTLVEGHKEYKDVLLATSTRIDAQSVIKDDLVFSTRIEFQQGRFEKFIEDVFDGRRLNAIKDLELRSFTYKDDTFGQDVEKILRWILEDEVLKSTFSKKEAIKRLLANWHGFHFEITQNGDEIAQMSPGKKSFVLLRLLVELSDNKCPILLDQPEDDLDNRSIYRDLVTFIRQKKKERQIIIATHNPNLVVGADAECVIVANQHGNKTHRFEYVQGALEHTFADATEDKPLYKQGTQEHVCEILEGGREAFNQRRRKYGFSKT